MPRRNRVSATRRPQRIKLIPVRVARMLEQIADDTQSAILYMGRESK